MPLLVFTHTLISFFCVLSWGVGVGRGKGPDPAPLASKNPSRITERGRNNLTGSSAFGIVWGENYCDSYTLVGQRQSSCLAKPTIV
jgi:hypothetical protein